MSWSLQTQVIQPHNTCTIQLDSSIVFKYLFTKPIKIGNKNQLLNLHFACEIVLIIVSTVANYKLLWLSLIVACSDRDPEKKEANNYLIKVEKRRSINSPPALRLGFLHFDKRQRRIGSSVAWFSTFPDYLSFFVNIS